MSNQTPGLCWCGCGGRVTRPENMFIHGHHHKGEYSGTWYKFPDWLFVLPKDYPNCACGCGKKVRHVKDRYIVGHNSYGQVMSPESMKKRVAIRRRKYGITYEDPEKHEQAKIARSIKLKEYYKNISNEKRDAWKKKISKALRGRTFTEEHKRALSKAGLGKHSNVSPKSKERVGPGHKRWWASLNDIEKEQFLRRTLFNAKKKPNKSETFLSTILRPLGFLYNTKMLLDIRVKPDFKHSKEKYIIEFNGPGGHDPKVPWVPDNIQEIDEQRYLLYTEHGYRTLFLTDTDLHLGEAHIIEKVTEFFA